MPHARLFSKNTMRGTVVTVGALVALAACSSSNKTTSPGADGGGPNEDAGGLVYTVSNCPSGGTIGDTCVKCLSTLCTPELDAVNTACASAFACACPVGVDANACPLPPAACTAAASSAVNTCTSCTSICRFGSTGPDGDASSNDSGSNGDAHASDDAAG
jgi:hypothetical protein